MSSRVRRPSRTRDDLGALVLWILPLVDEPDELEEEADPELEDPREEAGAFSCPLRSVATIAAHGLQTIKSDAEFNSKGKR